MSVYTTEIASDTIPSDNPVHQRLLQAYYLSQDYIKGNVLEVGCGEGRGVQLVAPKADSYTGLDKITPVIDGLKSKYPEYMFIQAHIPPFAGIASDSYDVVVSFQVIEHIRKDTEYLNEIHRVLKPGGIALITTPNIKMSLTRNPWHVREYTSDELIKLSKTIFSDVTMKGITGNEKVMEYYLMNKKSVDKITRWDIFKLQYRLPAFLLRIPYDLLNRMNRNKLVDGNGGIAMEIKNTDYILSDDPDNSLDLFCILKK